MIDILHELAVTNDEYRKWLALVELLKESNAVTQSDCDSPASAFDTKGQQLFEAIRQWGESLAALRIRQAIARADAECGVVAQGGER